MPHPTLYCTFTDFPLKSTQMLFKIPNRKLRKTFKKSTKKTNCLQMYRVSDIRRGGGRVHGRGARGPHQQEQYTIGS